MSKVIIEKDYIKIPRDFKSIHNLKDLIAYTDHFTELADSLTQYKGEYVKSFLRSADEVLAAIPKNQHKLYTVQHVVNNVLNDENKFKTPCDNVLEKIEKKMSKEESDSIEWGKRAWMFPKKTLSEIIRKYAKANHKMFMIDTVNKIVFVCYWAKPSLYKTKTSLLEYEKDNCPLTYSGIKIHVDSKLNIIIASAEFEYPSKKSKYTEWYRQGQYVDCIDTAHEQYVFCTKTNKLLGSREQYEHTKRYSKNGK